MIDKCLVSVVVPVYKVEKCLRRCIDSIINQTFTQIEIILVNDGSPDGSGEICDKYSMQDRRVKAFHKENGGLSDARNYGIDRAKGEYILFVDSDDYIEFDAIEKMLFYANRHSLDVVCADMCKISEGNSKSVIKRTTLLGGASKNKIMTGEEYLVDCIYKKQLSVAACTRMYKTQLIKKNKIYFKKGLLHEDENWTPKILLAANRIGYFNFVFYNYIIREDSITQAVNKKKHISDVMITCEELESEYNKLLISNKNKRILKDYLARLYINTCTYGDFDKKFYTLKVDRLFALRNSFFIKTKLEALIFYFSIELYRNIKLKFK
ncbi:glycosyl transferase family A [Siminovitchia terrae]|uniref:Glycosyl transferase family A n=1 Tax=Siminovitchia terrae TaxID=1914933 RepID=A0ABQ4KY05_SIMTE|nr:glycosyltransferase [Siminovitchia terrae]GIN96860.1 glycosyl transferase family A [Siminovitchia terrae]